MRLVLAGMVAAVYVGIVLLGCGKDDDRPVSYEMRTVADSVGNCESDTLPCARVTVTYPEIERAKTDGLKDSLNLYIRLYALQNFSFDKRISTFEEHIRGFLTGYEQMREAHPDYALGWEDNITITVEVDSAGLLGLRFHQFIFSGGAHPNSLTYFVNLDPETGGEQKLDAILVDGFQAGLNTIGERRFREVREIADTTNLAEAGFWFADGRFVLNDNYLIAWDGVTFFFNSYEIGPYAIGPTELFIPWEDLEGLIRQDSPLGSLGG